MDKLCWMLTLLAACAAGLQLGFTFVASTSAPQQAAGAAIAIGLAVIPYVFTRCITGLMKPDVAKVEIVEATRPAAHSSELTA